MIRLKAAIAGLGFMGGTHLEALRRLGIEVTGVLGISEDEARAFCKRTGVKRIYQSFEEIAADPEVDVVHICTPNHLHHPFAMQAMQSGKHVICEKPLALTVNEARELKELCEEKNLIGAVNYSVRFYPLCREAHDRVRSGELGNIRLIHGQYLQDWLFLPTDWNWRLEAGLGGELRAVSDIGTHWMDMVTWITGQEITEVMADLQTLIPVRYKPKQEVETFASKITHSEDVEPVEVNTEDYGGILFRFSGGARGNLMVSQVSAGRKNRFWWELNGSKSSLAWDQETPNRLWLGSREVPNQDMIKDPALMGSGARSVTGYPGGHAEGYPDTFVQAFKTIYQYIETGNYEAERLFATFDEGWRELVLCEAIKRSAQEGRWIKVKY